MTKSKQQSVEDKKLKEEWSNFLSDIIEFGLPRDLIQRAEKFAKEFKK